MKKSGNFGRVGTVMKRFTAIVFGGYDYVYDVKTRTLYNTWCHEGWEPMFNTPNIDLSELSEFTETPLLRTSLIKGIFNWEAVIDETYRQRLSR